MQKLRKDALMNITEYIEYTQSFRIYESKPLSDFSYTSQWKVPLFSVTMHVTAYNFQCSKLC